MTLFFSNHNIFLHPHLIVTPFFELGFFLPQDPNQPTVLRQLWFFSLSPRFFLAQPGTRVPMLHIAYYVTMTHVAIIQEIDQLAVCSAGSIEILQIYIQTENSLFTLPCRKFTIFLGFKFKVKLTTFRKINEVKSQCCCCAHAAAGRGGGGDAEVLLT